MTRDSQLHVDDGRKPFKVGHLFRLQGKEHVEIDEGVPGDICAVAKVDEIGYGAVLHGPGGGGRAAARTGSPARGDVRPCRPGQDPRRRAEALRHPLEARGRRSELPGRAQHRDPGDGDPRARRAAPPDDAGADEGALPRRGGDPTAPHPLPRDHSPPRPRGTTATRSRPAAPASSERSSCGVEPKGRGEGFEFVDNVVGGGHPVAVRAGGREGHPPGPRIGRDSRATGIDDVKVTVYDGKHHPVDSKEIAFVMAGKKAFLDAVGKARPIVLEPVVDLEVTVPQSNMGDIAGDLSGKRGRVGGTESLAGGYVAITRSGPAERADPLPDRAQVGHGGRGQLHHGLQPLRPGAPPHPGKAGRGVQAGGGRGLSARRRSRSPTVFHRDKPLDCKLLLHIRAARRRRREDDLGRIRGREQGGDESCDAVAVPLLQSRHAQGNVPDRPHRTYP